MADGVNVLQKTCGCKWLGIVRLAAGVPLVAFGAMHLAGAMPMKPLLEAAGLPMPGPMSMIAPLAQLVAGLLLVSGFQARLGGLIAIGTMLGALVTHVKIPNDAWPMPTPEDAAAVGAEPVFMMGLAIVVLAFSALVIWRGAGAWSLDKKMTAGANDPA